MILIHDFWCLLFLGGFAEETEKAWLVIMVMAVRDLQGAIHFPENTAAGLIFGFPLQLEGLVDAYLLVVSL